MTRVAVEHCDGYANIRHRRNPRVPERLHYVEILSNRKVKGRDIFKKIILPRYDMSLVEPGNPRYASEDFDREVFNKCMATEWGKQTVNQLRREKTDYLVDEFLNLHRNRVRIAIEKLARGDVGTYVRFLKNLLRTPVDEPAPISKPILTPRGNDPGFVDPVLCLTVEEIWNRFKYIGLVKKVTSKL